MGKYCLALLGPPAAVILLLHAFLFFHLPCVRPISWGWAGQSSALTRPLPVLSHQPRRQSTFGCKTEGEKPLVKVPQLSLCPYTVASGQVRVQKIHAAHTQAPQTGAYRRQIGLHAQQITPAQPETQALAAAGCKLQSIIKGFWPAPIRGRN